MAKSGKSKTDLFATLEDDLKQFWNALSGTVRAAPGAIVKQAGQLRQAIKRPAANEKGSEDAPG
jgi:hypothetical protein